MTDMDIWLGLEKRVKDGGIPFLYLVVALGSSRIILSGGESEPNKSPTIRQAR
jgi:hypothetical protein